MGRDMLKATLGMELTGQFESFVEWPSLKLKKQHGFLMSNSDWTSEERKIIMSHMTQMEEKAFEG